MGAENGATPLHPIVEPLSAQAAAQAVFIVAIPSESEPSRAELLTSFDQAQPAIQVTT